MGIFSKMKLWWDTLPVYIGAEPPEILSAMFLKKTVEELGYARQGFRRCLFWFRVFLKSCPIRFWNWCSYWLAALWQGGHNSWSQFSFYNLFLKIFLITVTAVFSTLSFYFYGLFNDLSHFTITQVYYSSVYSYLVGAALFEFVIKPRRNKA